MKGRRIGAIAGGLVSMIAIVAIVAIVAIIASILVIGSHPRSDTRAQVVDGASTSQRLVIAPRPITVVDIPDLAAADLTWSTTFTEAASDGTTRLVPVQLPESFLPKQVVPTDDGGLLIAGSEDLRPGEPRQDGLAVEDVDFPLYSFGQSGDATFRQDLRIVGEAVALIGATQGGVVLQRGVPGKPARIVARDLSTTNERVLGTIDDWAIAADLAGDIMVLAGANCRTQAVGLSSNVNTPLELPNCTRVDGVRIASDATKVAVVYQTRPYDRPSELRVAIFDVATGVRTADSLLGYTLPFGDPDALCRGRCPSGAPVDFAGLAWGEGQVRIALIRHPEGGDPRDVSMPDSLHIESRAA